MTPMIVVFGEEPANLAKILASLKLDTKTKPSVQITPQLKRMGVKMRASTEKDCLGLTKLVKLRKSSNEEWRRKVLGQVFIELKKNKVSVRDAADFIGYHYMTLYDWSRR